MQSQIQDASKMKHFNFYMQIQEISFSDKYQNFFVWKIKFFGFYEKFFSVGTFSGKYFLQVKMWFFKASVKILFAWKIGFLLGKYKKLFLWMEKIFWSKIFFWVHQVAALFTTVAFKKIHWKNKLGEFEINQKFFFK